LRPEGLSGTSRDDGLAFRIGGREDLAGVADALQFGLSLSDDLVGYATCKTNLQGTAKRSWCLGRTGYRHNAIEKRWTTTG
jgi:hypothetical protein